jgi:hypothetical protein
MQIFYDTKKALNRPELNPKKWSNTLFWIIPLPSKASPRVSRLKNNRGFTVRDAPCPKGAGSRAAAD